SGVPGGAFQDWGAVKQVFDDGFKDMIINGNGSIDMAMLNAANAKLDGLRK
ncbi:MAG: hypothetical protein HQ557_02810, partial [Bacteroidetes bacterium]|nr:hypothetical protein [Bacteroidota bacterium]